MIIRTARLSAEGGAVPTPRQEGAAGRGAREKGDRPVNTEVIWQIAGIGILVVVAHSVIKAAGREELAWMITLAGVAVVLWRVVGLIGELFQAVRSVFNL